MELYKHEVAGGLDERETQSESSIGVAADDAVPEGHPQDAQVQPRVPVRDVVQIVLNPFPQRCVAAPTMDLGPAGDAGFHAVAGPLILNNLSELLDENP